MLQTVVKMQLSGRKGGYGWDGLVYGSQEGWEFAEGGRGRGQSAGHAEVLSLTGVVGG